MVPSSEDVVRFVAMRDPQRLGPPGTLWAPVYSPAAPTGLHQAPRAAHGVAACGVLADKGKVSPSGRLRCAGQPLQADDARSRLEAAADGRRQICQAGGQREFPGQVREPIRGPEPQARVARHLTRALVPAVPRRQQFPRSRPAAGPGTVLTVVAEQAFPFPAFGVKREIVRLTPAIMSACSCYWVRKFHWLVIRPEIGLGTLRASLLPCSCGGKIEHERLVVHWTIVVVDVDGFGYQAAPMPSRWRSCWPVSRDAGSVRPRGISLHDCGHQNHRNAGFFARGPFASVLVTGE
jgi:hypothetical protein